MENPKVFFSYSRADSVFVLRLAKDLRSEGVDLWIDQLDIAAGERWDRAIEDALGAAPCLLVVLSPASVASNNVMDEVSLAFDERKKIVPVLARECTIPFRLRRLQHIDFTADYDGALDAVLRALKAPRKPEAELGRDRPRNTATVQRTERAGSGPAGSAVGGPIDPRLAEPPARSSSARARGPTNGSLVLGALGLAATAGALAFVLASRSVQPVTDHVSQRGMIEMSASPETVPAVAAPSAEARAPEVLLPPGPDGERPPFFPPPPPPPPGFGPGIYLPEAGPPTAVQASLSPSRDTSPKPRVGGQFSPGQPVNGVWDVTLTCGGGSELKEYGARFTDGVHVRAFEGATGSRNTRLALELVGIDTIRLTGSVAVGVTAISNIDATGERRGDAFVGLGTYGSATNCWLTITDRS